MFVKYLVGVVVTISIITALGIWVGRAASQPLPPYRPPTVTEDMPPEELGAILYEQKGCITCHTIDGSARIGPTFLHDAGSRITLDNGDTIIVDVVYLRESIEMPRAKSRPGYPPAMPAEYGTLLTDREKAGLVAYIVSLR